MRVTTPLISWHDRKRVSAADFQPVAHPAIPPRGGFRLATAGDDHHVVIWELVAEELQCLCDLNRHQNSVNIVRWSPSGETLASGDTDSSILLWQYSDKEAAPDLFAGEGSDGASEGNICRENWVVFRSLRGHLQDVVDLSWSPCSSFLVSCSTDNTAIVFDTVKDKRVKILSDHKGWVNGVVFDPKDQYLATIASDRCLRLYKTKTLRLLCKTYKCSLVLGDSTEEKSVRLFHDDTFQSFYRRLDFSPDGELLVVPSGVLDVEGEAITEHCTYVFTRMDFSKPVLYLPNKEFSVAVRFSPVKYELRPSVRGQSERDDGRPCETLFGLPYRLIYTIATPNTVLFYDTQQEEPFAKISKIHYIGLNDLTWSADGNTLIICSTDGFCSIVTFQPGELGQPYRPDDLNESLTMTTT